MTGSVIFPTTSRPTLFRTFRASPRTEAPARQTAELFVCHPNIAIRPKLRSPGHPKYQRHVEAAFWEQIAKGLLAEESGGRSR